VRVAEEFAMIDTLTGGRLIAGLLRGAPYEYLVYSVDPAESRSRYEEAWDLVLKAWTEPRPFGWDGEHYHFRTVSIWPRPIQQPHPPVFVSGSSRDSGQFAARKRVGLGLAFTTLPLAAEAARYYRECAAEHGWEPTPDEVVYQVPIYVSDTDERAFAEIRPHLEYASAMMAPTLQAVRLAAGAGFFGARDAAINARFQNIGQDRGRSLESQVEQGQFFCGGPDSVFAQIRRLREEVGAGVVNLIFEVGSLPHDAIVRCMQLFGREVLPRVREL
jgi:alkanesulfonate monooxygenase SsuD/methylene tetrahydromethanopterin reductase-like flavin-dependent oxidoreductase (luciferase family)